MRQISRIVPQTKGTGTRPSHILTNMDSMGIGELIYRMGVRWRHEKYFRYERGHFGLDAHDSYTSGDDHPERMVPNPAKERVKGTRDALQLKCEKFKGSADAFMLAISIPESGESVVITNQMHAEMNVGYNAHQ